MSETLAIEGVRRQVRELADGTLEVKIHVEPRHKADFHRLFAEIDTPVALAPLRIGKAPVEASPQQADRKGGKLAQLAGMMCDEPRFRKWVASQHWMVPVAGGGGRAIGAESVEALDTPGLIRLVCGVKSRADLDHNEAAAERFHTYFRKPWARLNGGSA